ncbi:MAG: hypothetical protein ACMUJM_20075 [bacterium]
MKHSALRDVAGMLRSFHYAAYASFLRYFYCQQDEQDFSEKWLKAWYTHVCKLFLSSYLRTVNNIPLLPQDSEDFHILFNAYLLEKAVYELGYELDNRPDWVMILIRGIQAILFDLAE